MMVLVIKENFRITKEAEKECIIIKMETDILETGMMISFMVKEFIYFRKETDMKGL